MIKTINEQTGFKRRLPVELLQDIDLLGKITEFDYDIYNYDFRVELSSRGVFNTFDPDKEKEGRLLFWMSKYPTHLLTGEKYYGSRQIQDCWEIFKNKKAASNLLSCFTNWRN